MFKRASLEKRAEWQEVIERQQKSGLSIQRWCHEHQIKAHLFHYWKNELFRDKPISKANFIELKEVKSKEIVIEYKGFHIHLEDDFSPQLFKKCLIALKEV